jgi:hypothetical protein
MTYVYPLLLQYYRQRKYLMLTAFLQSCNGEGDSVMMSKQENGKEEYFTAEEIRHLKLAVALALGSEDIEVMPITKTILNELYEKLDRIYHTREVRR